MGGGRKTCEAEQSRRAMESMLEEGLHSDLKVEVGVATATAEESYYEFAMAHRSVLASMSPVFRSILERSSSDSIRVEEISSSKALRAFLRIMYVGSVDPQSISWEQGLEILAASHKYQLPLVKAVAAKALADMLTVDNCLAILEYADRYDGGLMRRCRAFVEKRFKEVVLTKGFEELAGRKPSLLVGLVRNKMKMEYPTGPRKILSFFTSKFLAPY